jgi:hypothetical protein
MLYSLGRNVIANGPAVLTSSFPAALVLVLRIFNKKIVLFEYFLEACTETLPLVQNFAFFSLLLRWTSFW